MDRLHHLDKWHKGFQKYFKEGLPLELLPVLSCYLKFDVSSVAMLEAIKDK